MGKEITISIDNRAIQCGEGVSILEAADAAGIYIPRLCYHPDLSAGPGTKASNRVYRHGEFNADSPSADKKYDGCNVCLVEIEGRGPSPSCATPVEEGMVIRSETAEILEARKTNLAKILSRHPHACLLCSENNGCDREKCPQGEVKQGRCCPKFGNCEFQKICDYVTIKDNVSQYISKDIPVVDTPFFTINSNLCVGCTRCVRACEKMQGKRVVGFTYSGGEFVLGTVGPTHRESGCVFCSACVTVCPTGAHMAKGVPWKKKEKLNFTPVKLPPENNFELTGENILKIPEVSGVYELLDEKAEIIYIKGAENMRSDLQEKITSVDKACFFRFEEDDMYSTRENEMLAQHLKKNGALPEVNNEIADLY
jgi:formate dehydrogenase (NADP+) beta subunit